MIAELTPDQFTERIWEEYLLLNDMISLEFDPDSPPPPHWLVRDFVTDPGDDREVFRWLAIDDATGRLMGRLVADYPNEHSPLFEQSLSTADVDVTVFPEFRRRGIATELLREASRLLVPLDRGEVQTGFSMDSGRAFFNSHGAKIVAERAINRLYVKDVDTELMRSWIRECPARQSGVSVEMFETVPEDDLEEYCGVYTACGKSAPDYDEGYVASEQLSPRSRRQQESKWKDRGIRCFTFVSREPDGTISGLTECYLLESRPHMAEQELTGVLTRFRGRKLGRWLKAEMILFLMKEFPELRFLETGNLLDNGPMMVINTEMGYRKFRDHYLAKVDLERLL